MTSSPSCRKQTSSLPTACTSNVSLSVGYSLIYWDNVALAGEQVDSDIDFSDFPASYGSRPRFEFENSSLWVQGIDLGLVIDI